VPGLNLAGIGLVGARLPEKAVADRDRALKYAREIGRAATLMIALGVTSRDLLAPVYGRFSEGFDTLDLKGAKALLDALTF
jgi:hypothetical protein